MAEAKKARTGGKAARTTEKAAGTVGRAGDGGLHTCTTETGNGGLQTRPTETGEGGLRTRTTTADAAESTVDVVESTAFAVGIARVVAENRLDDVAVLDLRGLTGVADFFVLGTGTSDRQMHAVLDRIGQFARSIGRKPYRVGDSSSARWILADYVDVVVHLFDAEHRAYYDLDSLWGDAPRVEWRNGPGAG